MNTPRINDLTGRRFGRQVVLRFTDAVPDKNGGRQKFYWRVRCDCGDERDVIGASMVSGKSRMCASCKHQKLRVSNPNKDNPGYGVWANMMQRCSNPNNIGWKNYGGRGIRVCRRWRSFTAFWSDMGSTYRAGLTIERENNDGDYTPGNCRWATRKEQAYNRRSNRVIDTPWGRMTITEAAERIGVTPMTLHSRLKRIPDASVVFSLGRLPPRGRLSSERNR